MHLVAYLKTGPTARHAGGWRHPEAVLDDFLSPSRYIHLAKLLESAKFDGCFFADLFGLYDIHDGNFDAYVRRGGQISYLDPMTVLPIMAAATSKLGLGATLSTTFYNPYHLARALASLDVLSGGRAAWNVVTSATELEAQNAGMDQLPSKDERYDRADEVLEACMALWNSWDADPFLLDKAQGTFADPSKVHYANYKGKWVKTRGPLSIPRSPQGRPVIMQAGGSDRGRIFAARWAEAIFTVQRDQEGMRRFYQEIKGGLAKWGRSENDCAILPAVSVVVGETESIAQERAEYLRSLVDGELVAASASSNLGVDINSVASEKELASKQRNQGMAGSEILIKQSMAANNIGFKEAAQKYQPDMLVGTPQSIADQLQHLFESEVCDGFIVTPTYSPGMLEQFCRAVVPELQRRGVFRKEYSGSTLRQHLQSDAA
ncbi:MAG TPA: NtaA/DmoA family FMN-dependent monooxygenase [Bordetella sp.]